MVAWDAAHPFGHSELNGRLRIDAKECVTCEPLFKEIASKEGETKPPNLPQLYPIVLRVSKNPEHFISMARVNLRLNRTTGLGTLECVGGSTFKCGGMPGFAYPADATIQATDKKGDVRSREYVNDLGEPSLMKWSVLWIGQRGVYFHGYPTLGGSHGCIHLLEADARRFYDWIKGRTRIVFQWTG
jgi:hypothetical protein